MPDHHPTLYITNWSSRRTPGHFGRGTPWTIMAKPIPARGHLGEGAVRALVPDVADLEAVLAGDLTTPEYRARYLAGRPPLHELRPGALTASGPTVDDGDTLCCACSRARAAAGECHRVFAAGLLLSAGWRVVLDGRELERVDEDGRPVWVGEPAPGRLL